MLSAYGVVTTLGPCRHWREGRSPAWGFCRLGRYGGRPSLGTCARCPYATENWARAFWQRLRVGTRLKAATTAVGVKPCGGCGRRARLLDGERLQGGFTTKDHREHRDDGADGV